MGEKLYNKGREKSKVLTKIIEAAGCKAVFYLSGFGCAFTAVMNNLCLGQKINIVSQIIDPFTQIRFLEIHEEFGIETVNFFENRLSNNEGCSRNYSNLGGFV